MFSEEGGGVAIAELLITGATPMKPMVASAVNLEDNMLSSANLHERATNLYTTKKNTMSVRVSTKCENFFNYRLNFFLCIVDVA